MAIIDMNSQHGDLAELASRARALLSLTETQATAFVASAYAHAARWGLDPVELARDALERSVGASLTSGALVPSTIPSRAVDGSFRR